MTEARVTANGLEHHVLTWGGGQNAAASTVFLIHGFRDAAGTWDRIAPVLAAAGHRVIAPDMRGFGEGPRAPSGAYYHFPDYVADLDGLIRALVPDEQQVSLVGHSMGGTVVTLYAGARPERVRRLVSIEGLGPPDNGLEMGPVRMHRWLEDLKTLRPAAPIPRAEARRRFGVAHAYVPAAILDHRFPHLVHELPDGMVQWRYDPLHGTTAPMPFFAALFKEYAKRVTCPVLFVSGGERGFHPPDEAERIAAFAQCETVTLEDAGHMVHWTKPDALAELLVSRLG